MNRRSTLLAVCLALTPLPAAAQGSHPEVEHLPTPYTAEQIRDASPLGLEIVTRTTTPDGESLSLGEIVARDVEGATFSSRALDAAGEPTGEPVTGTATWEELRRHALLPADRTTRERVTRETALGTLEGWLYTVAGDGGSLTELFFADAFPGAPVVYESTRAGDLLLRSEQIERRSPE